MSKQEPQSEPMLNDIVVDDDVKQMMGLPPEEASPASLEAPAPDPPEPIGPPEVDGVDSEIDVLASDVNKQIVQEQETIKQELQTKDSKTSSGDNQEDDYVDADALVEDIIAKEGDDLLAADDAKAAAVVPVKSKKSIGHFFGSWWRNKRLRNITLLVIFASIIALALIPFTRYKILNLIGVRASMSLQVIDQKSGFPIKNVAVAAGGAKGVTDNNGKITLQDMMLGKTQLQLVKRSFAPINQTIVVGWGSNPYVDPFQMSAIGSSYVFIVKDSLSGKPITKAEVSDGESVAISGDDGRAVLIIQPNDSDLSIIVKAKDYRQEKIALPTTATGDTTVMLTAGKPDVFVSKRSGKYDLYKRDVDGKNETVLLAGTGSEQESLALLVHPDANVAAYVSSRDGKRNKDGYLLSNLYMVDINGKTATKVEGTESEQIQLIDWVGDTLIFVKMVAGPSGNTNGRQRIISYDTKLDKQTEIATANYFNDVEVLKGKLYYAISGSPQLIRINADSSAKTVLLDKETWAMYRTTYDKLLASAANNKWYEQNLADASMVALPGAPAAPIHRIYIDNPVGDKTVWLDNRDGKGVLILQDIKTSTEKTILTMPGLSYPIRWLSDKHLIIRVTTSSETANYIFNIDGGDIKKIGDVTNTAPTNRWYYYH